MESDGVLSSSSSSSSGPLSEADDAEWRSDYVIKDLDSHNLQRPETVESLFYMWRITGEEMYREWGWEMFKAFVKYTEAGDGAGFTSLAKANEVPPILKDDMESFWLVSRLRNYLYKYIDLVLRLANFLGGAVNLGRNAQVFLSLVFAD